MEEEATQPQTQPQTQEYINISDDADNDTVCILLCTTNNVTSRLVLKQKGNSQQEWKFGRNPSCDFQLNDSKRLSNCHFIIWSTEDAPNTLLLKDTSTNGTYLNNARLIKDKSFMIVQGDEISIGNGVPQDEIRFVVQIPKSTRSMATKGIHAMYDIGTILGQGAFAVVHKAIERVSGKVFAIKIISKRKISNNVAVQREIEILKQLNHQYVVGLKDFYEDSSSYYLVMDYVGGGDLMDFVISNGPIAEDASREVIRQVLSGVDYVHGLGISHRDLKPDNILIAQDNPVVIKVSDFGLAKISQTGSFLKTFCGTLAYLAPEVMSGRNKQQRPNSSISATTYSNLVDIWSIGCLAYVILTGYLPFDGSTQEHLYHNVVNGKFLMGPLSDNGISANGIDFISQLLQVDPLKRPSAKQALQLPWIKEGESQPETNTDSAQSEGVNGLPVSDLQLSSYKDGRSSESDLSDDKTPFSAPEEPPEKSDPMYDSQAPFSGIRDLDNEPASQLIEKGDLGAESWLRLATIPESIPFHDMYISQSRVKIGRRSDGQFNDVCIQDSRISKRHCDILLKKQTNGLSEVWLLDQSSNGCLINNELVGKGKKALLQNDDTLYLFLDLIDGKRELLGFKVDLGDPSRFISRRNGSKLQPIAIADYELDTRFGSEMTKEPASEPTSPPREAFTLKKRSFGMVERNKSTEEPPRKLMSLRASMG